MDTPSKNPDRINITKKARELVSKIDETKYFGLQDNIISRSELFLFAMAIGADTIPTKLENTYPGGLILEKSIENRTKALMYALFIKNLEGKDLDEIAKKDAVYTMAQEYANTGFEIIEDYMGKKKDIDLIWDLLEELDSQYQSIIGV
ncbi:MAG: hypothetical protein APF77_05325 [Clostridia bacterium BRH_c25]|nr:MAG: hypothetical protein APF77_05325 [Clostridia bacterium BRH_c25]